MNNSFNMQIILSIISSFDYPAPHTANKRNPESGNASGIKPAQAESRYLVMVYI